MTTLEWIQKGRTGCTFATLFSKDPESIGWKFYNNVEWNNKSDGNIISITFFEGVVKEQVREWALQRGFYVDVMANGLEGLRRKVEQGEAWVQYFGPDSHVKTRQAPQPMLLYCNKTGVSYYWKVGFQGILHLAHAWKEGFFTKKKADTMWNRSHKQSEKIIGHKLGDAEAAKVTFLR